MQGKWWWSEVCIRTPCIWTKMLMQVSLWGKWLCHLKYHPSYGPWVPAPDHRGRPVPRPLPPPSRPVPSSSLSVGPATVPGWAGAAAWGTGPTRGLWQLWPTLTVESILNVCSSSSAFLVCSVLLIALQTKCCRNQEPRFQRLFRSLKRCLLTSVDIRMCPAVSCLCLVSYAFNNARSLQRNNLPLKFSKSASFYCWWCIWETTNMVSVKCL